MGRHQVYPDIFLDDHSHWDDEKSQRILPSSCPFWLSLSFSLPLVEWRREVRDSGWHSGRSRVAERAWWRGLYFQEMTVQSSFAGDQGKTGMDQLVFCLWVAPYLGK